MMVEPHPTGSAVSAVPHTERFESCSAVVSPASKGLTISLTQFDLYFSIGEGGCECVETLLLELLRFVWVWEHSSEICA